MSDKDLASFFHQLPLDLFFGQPIYLLVCSIDNFGTLLFFSSIFTPQVFNCFN